MALCLFASDLHGQLTRYRALFNLIQRDRPAAVFLGRVRALLEDCYMLLA